VGPKGTHHLDSAKPNQGGVLGSRTGCVLLAVDFSACLAIGVIFKLIHRQECIHKLHDDNLLFFGHLLNVLKALEQCSTIQPSFSRVLRCSVHEKVGGGA
jgi:hypothetical protein